MQGWGMYVPPAFRIDDPVEIAAFMRRNAFATLVGVHEGEPFATHLPLLVDGEGESLALAGHIARANPQSRSLAGGEILTIFSGPHAYVSPSWYAGSMNVPTWNYAAVHVYGRARLADPAETYEILRRLTDREERGRAEPWRLESLPGDYAGKLTRAIVAFTIVPSRVEAKYKLSQNHDRVDRETVARELSASPSEVARQAGAMMRESLTA
jgi:transcriptional regulator